MAKTTIKPRANPGKRTEKSPKGKEQKGQKQQQQVRGFIKQEVLNKIESLRALKKLDISLDRSLLGLKRSPSSPTNEFIRELEARLKAKRK